MAGSSDVSAAGLARPQAHLGKHWSRCEAIEVRRQDYLTDYETTSIDLHRALDYQAGLEGD